MRVRLCAAAIALVLVWSPARASVELVGASNAGVSFGDIAAIAALPEITIAFTIHAAGSLAGDFFVHQIGNLFSEQAFTIQRLDTDEIGCLVQGGGGIQSYYGDKTTDSPVTTDTLLRVVCQVDLSPADVDIWVNGALRTDTTWVHDSPTAISNTTSPVQVGNPTQNDTFNGVDGQYSEISIWNHKVPDWVAVAYGKGMSPKFYRTGGILYAPLINTNTDGLRDVWGGILGTNTAGTSVAHPSMYYPQ